MNNTPPRNGTHTKLSGASVYRGPMAGDNFTQIHNLVLRGKTAIHTRYVGVWGFITSHVEGWKLNETSIARELGVGTDFVRSALNAIESAGCLIRTRRRDAQGKLGDTAWFVTDLPIQLRQLGITDPEIVSAKVHEAYEQWRRGISEGDFPSAAPNPENPTLGVTCENDGQQHISETSQGCFPSAAPNRDFPSLGKPSLGNPATKKTIQKNTKEKNNQPSKADADSSVSEPAGSGDDGWLIDQHHENKHTEGASPGAVLLRSLQTSDGSRLNAAAAAEHAEQVTAYLEAGHSERQITEHLTAGIRSAGGIRSKLRKLAAGVESLPATPAASGSTTPASALPPVCGQCDAKPGEGPNARVIWHDTERTSWSRCTRCHPRASEPAGPGTVHDLPHAADVDSFTADRFAGIGFTPSRLLQNGSDDGTQEQRNAA